MPIVEPPPFFSLLLVDSDLDSDSNSSCPSVRASEIPLHRTTESLKRGRAIKAKKKKKVKSPAFSIFPGTVSPSQHHWQQPRGSTVMKKKKAHEELSRNEKGTQKPVPARLGRAQREIPPIQRHT